MPVNLLATPAADLYPVPGRMLRCCERIVHEFLGKEMCDSRPPAGKFDTLRLVAKGFANNLTTGAISRQERVLWLAPAVKREVRHEIRTILKNNTIFKSEGRELVAFKAGGV